MKFDHIAADNADLFLGFTHGSMGETSAALIILGAVYLSVKKMMNWRIPVSILVSVFIISGLLYLINDQIYPSPLFMILSGGLMLGACFMASDMVASPITSPGIMVYGFIIALLIVVIRIWGGLPEGVMYAILFGNALSPHIDNLIRPRVYGTSGKWSRS
jgi:electron transport complex protein RnfD